MPRCAYRWQGARFCYHLMSNSLSMHKKLLFWMKKGNIFKSSLKSGIFSHPNSSKREDKHFVWFSMWDGFFSPRVSESRPSRVATRVGFGDEWWEIHLTWKTIQNAFSRILYTLRHFNQAKYNVQSCRLWKPCEMDLSHNCSLHGGMSEVCENDYYVHEQAWVPTYHWSDHTGSLYPHCNNKLVASWQIFEISYQNIFQLANDSAAPLVEDGYGCIVLIIKI